ncbi:MAG: hypothetical protein HYX81_03595, partial [Chloroflexi bacterium]|nr:hypothetical protein [Chloroflexota bacterium]
ECGAFDPENALIMMTGPANATLAPAATRFTIAHKSPIPLKECYTYSSPGGHWSAQLKFAGYDGVVVKGKSPHPVYLWVNDGKAEIRSAGRLWGMTVSNLMLEIQNLHGPEASVLGIGPAGENLVRSAAILVDWEHATGITGAGAVMGSKNLKAIAVKGTGAVRVARPNELIDLWYYYFRLLNRKPGEKEYPHITKSLNYYMYHGGHVIERSGLPAKPTDPAVYFKNKGLDDPLSLMREVVDKGTVKLKWGGCYACPVCCSLTFQSQDIDIPSGSGQCGDIFSWVAHEWEGHKKLIGVPNIWMNRWCNDLGLSITNTAGFELGWFMELVKLGILTKENTGLPVVDKPWTLEFIKGFAQNAAYRKGEIFDQIAEGEVRFLKYISDKYPAAKPVYDWHITKQKGFFVEWKGSDLLSSILRAITCAIGTRHDQNRPFAGFKKSGVDSVGGLTKEQQKDLLKKGSLKFTGSECAFDIPGEPKTWKDKAQAAMLLQNLAVTADCITMCIWANCPPFYSRYTPDYLGDDTQGEKVYSAVTGIEMTHDEMIAAMDPIINIERCIHVREGRRREHDTFNDTFFKSKSWQWTNKEEFTKIMDECYQIRGWDTGTGVPKRATLEKQGLKGIADKLETDYGISVPV